MSILLAVEVVIVDDEVNYEELPDGDPPIEKVSFPKRYCNDGTVKNNSYCTRPAVRKNY
jgi:hypothetical protein